MDNSRLTQITRNSVSRPTRWLLENVDFEGKFVLHHGRGKAIQDTVAMLHEGAILVNEYDPNVEEIADFTALNYQYDIVVSNFVLNVLPPDARDWAFADILMASREFGIAYISVRTDRVNGTPVEDGVLTSRGTFQTQLSVQDWTDYFLVDPIHTDSGYAIFALTTLTDSARVVPLTERNER